MKKNEEQIIHPLQPIYNEDSKILILGTMPSVKSRENKMYYTHPKNRIWLVLSSIFNEDFPITNQDKINFVLKHNIALWDVLKSCKIKGSSDSSIKDPLANDFNIIFNNCNIKAIFTTGKKAHTLYKKLTGKECICLPSPSPANCAISLNELIESYSIILEYLN
jgi:hypoxanthine-DNA glycosylase